MVPRLIASDLDGTLLTPHHKISERTVAALVAARAAGVIVVFATGRSHFSTLPIIGGRELADWLVCSNGATVYDPSRGRVHHRLTVADELVAPLFSGVRAAYPGGAFAWETADGFLWDPEWPPLEVEYYRHRRVDRVGELPTDVTKILLGVPGVDPIDLVEPVAALLTNEVAVSTSGAPFIEITHRDAHKGSSLARLAADLGINPSEAMAFGDNHNDTTMLEWAGHAVVMEHAPEPIRRLAQQISVSNAYDGVARVIESALGS